jgi:hypothetical protein
VSFEALEIEGLDDGAMNVVVFTLSRRHDRYDIEPMFGKT